MYFNVHSVAPSATTCDDPSRRRMTFATFVVHIFQEHVNFVGWGPDLFNNPAPDAWRVPTPVQDVRHKIFANEALNFGACTFSWISSETSSLEDPNSGDPVPTDVAVAVTVDDYAGVSGLKVVCDDGVTAPKTAVVDVNDGSAFCAQSQHFLAVGDDTKALFPLQIMLVEGLPCAEAYDVAAPALHGTTTTAAPVAAPTPPPQPSLPSSSSSSSKKNNDDKDRPFFLGLIVALAALLLCFAAAALAAAVTHRKRKVQWQPAAPKEPADAADDVVTIQLPDLSLKNPVHEHTTDDASSVPTPTGPRDSS
mmetsp:Transcript_8499/g.26164  ORF Transcript_8499/g.26164 Transcript_8499/m.26164 type:complete len:308 (-) Transcript_8499:402-1325(-)